MFTLRAPTGAFVIAALKAGRSARFQGALLILSRRLPDDAEAELRRSWADLDDMTNSELLVITTGLAVDGHSNGITAYDIGRNVYAPGVGVVGSSSQLSSSFEFLLRVATHIPHVPDDEDASQRRLIDARGVTEIRRALNINEYDLPALLVVDYRAQIEYLLRLGTQPRGISPTQAVATIARNMRDVAHRYEALQAKLAQLQRPNAEYYELQGKKAVLTKQLNSIEGEMYHRTAAVAVAERKLRAATESAPQGIRSGAAEIIRYLHGELKRQPEDACKVVEQYLNRPDGPGAPRLLNQLYVLYLQGHHDPVPRLEMRERVTRDLESVRRLSAGLSPDMRQADAEEEEYRHVTKQLGDEIGRTRVELRSSFRGALAVALQQLGLKVATSVDDRGLALSPVIGRTRQTYGLSESGAVRPEVNADPRRTWDVFLSYSSRQLPVALDVAKQLKARGIRVWLDKWELTPGRRWQEALENGIESSKAIAILIGANGLSPWQVPETRSGLSEAVRRGLPVIPTLLPGLDVGFELPLFLRSFTWVDLRGGVTKDGIEHLVSGIKGDHSEIANTPDLR